MKSVEIGGKPYNVKFGLSALSIALKKYGLKTIDDTQMLIQKLEVAYLPEFLQLGLENAARILKNEPPTLDDINAEFDSNLGLLQEVLEIFAYDLGGDVEEPETEETPKKAPPKFKE